MLLELELLVGPSASASTGFDWETPSLFPGGRRNTGQRAENIFGSLRSPGKAFESKPTICHGHVYFCEERPRSRSP